MFLRTERRWGTFNRAGLRWEVSRGALTSRTSVPRPWHIKAECVVRISEQTKCFTNGRLKWIRTRWKSTLENAEEWRVGEVLYQTDWEVFYWRRRRWEVSRPRREHCKAFRFGVQLDEGVKTRGGWGCVFEVEGGVFRPRRVAKRRRLMSRRPFNRAVGPTCRAISFRSHRKSAIFPAFRAGAPRRMSAVTSPFIFRRLFNTSFTNRRHSRSFRSVCPSPGSLRRSGYCECVRVRLRCSTKFSWRESSSECDPRRRRNHAQNVQVEK